MAHWALIDESNSAAHLEHSDLLSLLKPDSLHPIKICGEMSCLSLIAHIVAKVLLPKELAHIEVQVGHEVAFLTAFGTIVTFDIRPVLQIWLHGSLDICNHLLIVVKHDRTNISGSNSREGKETMLPVAEQVSSFIVLKNIPVVLEVRWLYGFEVASHVTAILAHEITGRMEPVVILRSQVDDAVANLVASSLGSLDDVSQLLGLIVFLNLLFVREPGTTGKAK